MAARFQAVPTFIRGRQFGPGILVRRICDFTTTAISGSDKNRASGSTSLCTTRINALVALLSKRHAAHFDLRRDHRAAGPTRLRLPMAPLGYAVEWCIAWKHAELYLAT